MGDTKTKLAARLGPGALAGIRLWDWIRLLGQNRMRVSPQFLLRTGMITLSAPINSLLGCTENLLFRRRWERYSAEPPLFLLGGWRSGTTHLHNLIGLDPRFGYANLYQTMYPWSFILSESWWLPIMAAMTPKKRFQDNVALSMKEPAQDEMALCIMTLKSSMLSWVFPRNVERYDRYLTFQDVTAEEISVWKSAFRMFVQKVSCRTKRPLVLKSPYHTARIQLLLEIFPDAKFLHIHRHPFEIYPSFVHTLRKVIEAWGLQTYDETQLEEWAIETYKQLYDAYFDQQSAIPADRFHEIRYDDLSGNPLETLEKAYQALALPNFSEVRGEMQAYLDTLQSYQKNQYDELPELTKDRLRAEWSRLFEAWGYPSS